MWYILFRSDLFHHGDWTSSIFIKQPRKWRWMVGINQKQWMGEILEITFIRTSVRNKDYYLKSSECWFQRTNVIKWTDLMAIG